jgi:hypothetical protein
VLAALVVVVDWLLGRLAVVGRSLARSIRRGVARTDAVAVALFGTVRYCLGAGLRRAATVVGADPATSSGG